MSSKVDHSRLTMDLIMTSGSGISLFAVGLVTPSRSSLRFPICIQRVRDDPSELDGMGLFDAQVVGSSTTPTYSRIFIESPKNTRREFLGARQIE